MVDLCHFGYKITTLLGEGWIFTNCGEGPLVVGLQGISTADDLRAFLHIGDDLRGAIVHQIGDPGPHLRVLAALPPQVIVQSSVSATLPAGDNLTALGDTLGAVMAYERYLDEEERNREGRVAARESLRRLRP